jgi:hypothetical protein
VVFSPILVLNSPDVVSGPDRADLAPDPSPTVASAAEPRIGGRSLPGPAPLPGAGSPSCPAYVFAGNPHTASSRIRPANDRETSRNDENGWSNESAGQEAHSTIFAGSQIGLENTLKVETRVRTPLGLQARSLAHSSVGLDQRVSHSRRRAFVARPTPIRHDGTPADAEGRNRVGKWCPRGRRTTTTRTLLRREIALAARVGDRLRSTCCTRAGSPPRRLGTSPSARHGDHLPIAVWSNMSPPPSRELSQRRSQAAGAHGCR